MKQSAVIIMVFAIALAMSFLPSSAAAANLPRVIVESVTPQPAEPGDDLTVLVTLYNDVAELTDARVELVALFPFVLKSSQYDLSTVTLCGDCKLSNTYYLTVDAGARSGTYQLFVRASGDGASTTTNVDVKITGTPTLIVSTATDVQNIVPDAAFDVILGLTNIGTGTARQIRVTVNSSTIVSLGGSTQTVNQLGAGETAPVVFRLIASESLDAGSYTIPISLAYLDESGTAATAVQTLGVRVVNQGALNVQSITITNEAGSSYLVAGSPFMVIARIENVGHGTADYITAVVDCPFNGASQAFLGQLERNEDAPAVFNFVTTRIGAFTCTLNVNFTDDVGTHEVSRDFSVVVNTPDFSGALVLIIIVLIVLFVFRK